MDQPSIALASTLHDPEGNYAPFIQKLGGSLREIFPAGIYIVGTRATSTNTYDALREYCGGKEGLFGTTLIRSDLHSLQITLGRIAAASRALWNLSTTHVLSSDFDRVLKAENDHSGELRRILQKISSGEAQYVVLGRTKWALGTHPKQQLENELRVNRAIGKALGLKGPVDISTGASMFPREIGLGILAYTKCREEISATDVEWPLIARMLGHSVKEIKMDGMEYETPTFRPKEIEAEGYENWVRLAYDNPRSRQRRLQSAEQALAIIEKTLRREDITQEGIRNFIESRRVFPTYTGKRGVEAGV